MTRQEIKDRAKAQLGRNIFSASWMLALVVCLIASAILGACGSIPFVGAVAVVILSGPLAFGLAYSFLKQARDGQAMNIKDLFIGFNGAQFAQLLLLGLMQEIFIFLWSLLFVVPGIVKTYAYSMAYYIKADHPEYTWKQCLDESQKMMQGHKGALFVQDLSFIGWLIVGGLCFGVGSLWVQPYIQAARAQFYESLAVPAVDAQFTAQSEQTQSEQTQPEQTQSDENTQTV